MLRADWLTGAVTVPYVPTLGPVHPSLAAAGLFEAVFTLHPGHFLPWDKDRRWSERKHEQVLLEHLRQTAQRIAVATLTRRGAGRITLYEFARAAPNLPSCQQHAAALSRQHASGASRVVWFQHADPPAGVAAARVLLAPIGQPGLDPDRPIVALDECPAAIQRGFAAFARKAGPGMAHLARCRAAGRVTAPILVAVDRDQVLGAIGPMQVEPDPAGGPQLLPQYFAVLPDHRRGGHGRALWRAAQRWGHQAGAAYQLLQATAGGPAEALYRSEGAQPLGLVCTVPA